MRDMTKGDIIKIIEDMPDNVSLEDILYELYVHSEIEAALDDVRHGRTVSNEEVMDHISNWLRSAGH
jgi:predicted transcriptional regulator